MHVTLKAGIPVIKNQKNLKSKSLEVHKQDFFLKNYRHERFCGPAATFLALENV